MLEYTVFLLIISAFLMLAFKKDLIAIFSTAASFIIICMAFLFKNIETVRFGGWAPPLGIVWVADKFGLFIAILITGVSFLVALYSTKYIKEKKHRFYALLCLLTAGLLGVSLTGDIFNMYVFFEIMSISSYAIVSFFLDKDAIEGALKYLIIGSLSSSFILIGIALLYGLTGTLNMADLVIKISHTPPYLTAFGLILIGFAFKSAIIPFHAWKPDAIQGTPIPAGIIFTTASVTIGIYGITRIMFIFNLLTLTTAFIFFGVVTMIIGAILALIQINVKRMLAYSCISQVGYITMAIGLGTRSGLISGFYHILNNILIEALLFASIGCVIYATKETSLDKISVKNNTLLIATSIGILSLAGVPLFNGFVSKWLIYTASLEVNPSLTVIAVVISAITLAYGVKIISIFFNPSGKTIKIPKAMLVPVVVLAFLCILIGIFPHIGLSLVEPAVNALLNQNHYLTTVLG
ncbi:MAG: hypothetical protein J7K72_04955 [Candidatus Aenigmarchaeota archaeon]|nr:hypothetical protein [Candidatus Aenigmarchaeota archaeon]